MAVTFDFTGGLRVYGWKGNGNFGDCTVAALENLRTVKATTSASRVEKILYHVGFRPPGDRYTIEVYADYLATLGEKPGGDVGVDPGGFLEWCRTHQPESLIIAWARIDLISDADATMRSLALQYTGAMVTLELTPNTYRNFFTPVPWDVGPTPGDQPSGALSHEVALVRATEKYDVIATWDQNKLMTPAYADLCARTCYVVLMEEDTWRPDFPEKFAALQTLPGAKF